MSDTRTIGEEETTVSLGRKIRAKGHRHQRAAEAQDALEYAAQAGDDHE